MISKPLFQQMLRGMSMNTSTVINSVLKWKLLAETYMRYAEEWLHCKRAHKICFPSMLLDCYYPLHSYQVNCRAFSKENIL
jgi:hypothetical protein